MSHNICRRNSKKSNDKLKISKNPIDYFEEILFKKNKFKFVNNFDEQNSEIFLSHIDHYLKEICLTDKIYKKNLNENHEFKSDPFTSNNEKKYYIVVTNYDENKKE